PVIDRLHVGDVILIPPVEELDPDYIDPLRIHEVPAAFERGVQNMVAEPAEPSSSPTRRDSGATARTSRTSITPSPRRIASRSPRRTDALLVLPVGEAVSRRNSGIRRPDLTAADYDADDQGPEIRVTTRSRGSVPTTGPGYKVHPYDTLRSIARDTLGDAH